MLATRVVTDHETAWERNVQDVHEQNLSCDVISPDPRPVSRG